MTNQKICVCGGGHIGHSLLAAFGRYEDVSVFTRQPEKWAVHLRYQIGEGAWGTTKGKIIASSNPELVRDATLVVIALPRFAVEEELRRLEPYLHVGQTVVFIPSPAGLDKVVARLNHSGIGVVGFQRVPHVARILEYGKSVWMGEVRSVTRLALSDTNRKQYWKEYFETVLDSKVEFLVSFLSFTFSNSNPLLHPSRSVELLHQPSYTRCPLFYAEWGDEASRLYVEADEEMRRVFEAYSPEAVKVDYESALAHYEVTSVQELTKKMRSIKSLSQILAPYTKGEDGLYRPDVSSRYFTEDVPYGTMVIQKYAHDLGVSVPVIDRLIETVKPLINGLGGTHEHNKW